MAQLSNTFYFMNGDLDHSVAIDVTLDGDHYITRERGMHDGYAYGLFFVEFFDDKAMKIPSKNVTGKVYTQVSLTGEQWFKPNNGDFIDATKVVHGAAAYTPLAFNGPFIIAQVRTENIVGAKYMRAFMWRS